MLYIQHYRVGLSRTPNGALHGHARSALLGLTNGFSKKVANRRAMVAVFFVWYNFCWVHQTLRMTPAMEAGWTDHMWSVRELLTA